MRPLRSTRARLSLVVVCLPLVVAGCGRTPGGPESSPPTQASAPSAAPAAGLENTHWRLVQVAGHPPVVTPADRSEAYFILISDGRQMQGFGGCNRMGGTYETDGRSLKFGPVRATRMACADPRNPEDGFMKALEATAGARLTGDELELLDANGSALARFQARINPAG